MVKYLLKLFAHLKKNQVGFFFLLLFRYKSFIRYVICSDFFLRCCFIVFIGTFEEQQVLILMKYNLSNFSFINYAFGGVLKKILPNQRQSFVCIFF